MGISTVPKWLTLPTCMSSRTRPWLRTPFANAASWIDTTSPMPMIGAPCVAAPELARAIAADWRLHGSSPAASADDSKSYMQSFALATTSGVNRAYEKPASACAMRTASGAAAAEGRLTLATRPQPRISTWAHSS